MRTLIAMLAIGTAAVPARADGPQQHRGFFLRMDTGPGYLYMRAKTPDVTIQGSGGSLGVAIGGAIAENLILHAEALVIGTHEPDFEQKGASYNSRYDSADFTGIGPGLTYYFMPVNLYLSGTLAIVQAHYHDGRDLRTRDGLGLSLMVGKEWWVSANWGLGIAARLFGGAMKDRDIVDDHSRWNAGSFAVLFSATYN
jgi:hypothetical protein